VGKDLMRAEAASLQARNLVKQMLFFANSLSQTRKSMSIAGLLDETTETALTGTSIRSSIVIAPDLWLVAVDPVQMRQVVHHLTANAAEATPFGGTIEVEAENELVADDGRSSLPGGRYVRISIRDGGSYSETHCRKIFTPFFTARTLNRQPLTSLGMAIAETVVRSHQGVLTVESHPQSGIAYTIHLPAVLAVTKTPEAHPQSK
jgi:signal transduction histidine kinase